MRCATIVLLSLLLATASRGDEDELEYDGLDGHTPFRVVDGVATPSRVLGRGDDLEQVYDDVVPRDRRRVEVVPDGYCIRNGHLIDLKAQAIAARRSQACRDRWDRFRRDQEREHERARHTEFYRRYGVSEEDVRNWETNGWSMGGF